MANDILGIYDCVYRVYGQQKTSAYPLTLVGDVVKVAQELEYMLREKIKTAKVSIDGEPYLDGFILDKKSIKTLVEKLELPSHVESKLTNVADLRNWVVHSSYLEYDCKPLYQDGSTTDFDELVLTIISKYKLLTKDDADCLFEYLKQPRQVRDGLLVKRLTFPIINFAHNKGVNDHIIASHCDWVKLKIIITYCLIYEFQDFLNGNHLSVYTQKTTIICDYIRKYFDGDMTQTSTAECIEHLTGYKQAYVEGFIMAAKNMTEGETITRIVSESILEVIANLLIETGRAKLDNVVTALQKYMAYEPNNKKDSKSVKSLIARLRKSTDLIGACDYCTIKIS